MSVRKKVAIRVTILAIAGAMAVAVAVQKTIPSSPTVGSAATTSAAPTTKTTEPPAPSSLTSGVAKLEEELRKGGWKRAEVDAIVSLSGDWFDIMYGEARDQFEDQVKALARLGKYPEALKLVRMNPEFAGLLALADQPDDLAGILNTDSEKLQTLTGLFVRCTDRHDLNDLVIALKENRDVVVKLLDKGLLGAEVLFVFDRGAPGAKEYDLWLRETMEQKLLGDEDELASFVQFVSMRGSTLLQELNRSEVFRRDFRNLLWPKLVRTLETNREPLEHYMDDPYLWKLLAHKRGEDLLVRCGLLATALLFGPEAYAIEHHDRITEILLAGDGPTFRALTESPFRTDPKFLALLKRPLSGSVLAKSLINLMDEGKNYRPLLETYSRLSDDVLKKEVGPPPDGLITWLPLYSQYAVVDKWLDGRDPTTGDFIDAGVDTVIDVGSLIFPPAKSAKILKQSIMVGRKKLSREAFELGAKASAKKMTGLGGKKLAERELEHIARPWAITAVIGEMMRKYRGLRGKIGDLCSFDITEQVRFFYHHPSFGRATFKRLSSLEARIFMRADGKVFVHVDRLVCTKAKDYLTRLTLKEATETISVADHRKHLSGWWLSNLGGGMPTGNDDSQ